MASQLYTVGNNKDNYKIYFKNHLYSSNFSDSRQYDSGPRS